MKLKFVGAIERVTGSCSWLKYKDIEFLVDCGMVVDEAHADFENAKSFPFEPKNIKFVLLTHAHLDHCGLIPRLYKEDFVGKVYCTKATAKLAHEIMLDCAKISKNELYSKKDVDKVKYHYFDDYSNFTWGYDCVIDQDLFIFPYRSSHILGASSIEISWLPDDLSNKRENYRSILFTGDVGNNTKKNCYQPLLKHQQSPNERLSYIVCESTYGNRSRDPKERSLEHRINKLEKVILKTIYEKKGNLIIPAFSLHRTQEILFDLYYLLKIKWKGKLPVELYQSKTFKSFLTSKGFLQTEKLISYTEFRNLRDEMDRLDMAKTVCQIINRGHFYYFYDLKEAEFEKLLENFSEEKEKILKFTKKNDTNYCIFLSDQKNIDPRILAQSIKEYLLKEELEKCIQVKFVPDGFPDHKSEYLKECLNREIPSNPIKIVYDSPLGNRISKIYAERLTQRYRNKHGELKSLYFNSEIQKWFKCSEDEAINTLKQLYQEEQFLIGVHSISHSIENNTNPKPRIILTSAGMCDSGPVLGHLENNLKDERNTFLLTGFQSKSTNGYILSNLEECLKEEQSEIQKVIDLEKEKMNCQEIKAEIIEITGYSGHADQNALLDYLLCNEELWHYTIPNIFLNHGDNEQREDFKKKIEERSRELQEKYKDDNEIRKKYQTNVIIPKKTDPWYDLNKNKWIDDEPEVIQKVTDHQDIVQALNRLTKAVENLTQLVKTKKR